MIIFNDLKQGSDDWLLYRLGVPTASRFKDFIKLDGKLSTSQTAKSYGYQLIAEKLIAEKVVKDPLELETFKSGWMERGNVLEDEAVSKYEAKTNTKVSKVGIVLKDDLSCAISPDGVIYHNNSDEIIYAVEIKCPKLTTFIKWKLSGEMPSEHFVQVQSQMWGLGLSKMDFCFYHPDMGVEIITVKRDIEFIGNMEKAIETFTDQLKKDYERVIRCVQK